MLDIFVSKLLSYFYIMVLLIFLEAISLNLYMYFPFPIAPTNFPQNIALLCDLYCFQYWSLYSFISPFSVFRNFRICSGYSLTNLCYALSIPEKFDKSTKYKQRKFWIVISLIQMDFQRDGDKLLSRKMKLANEVTE